MPVSNQRGSLIRTRRKEGTGAAMKKGSDVKGGDTFTKTPGGQHRPKGTKISYKERGLRQIMEEVGREYTRIAGLSGSDGGGVIKGEYKPRKS